MEDFIATGRRAEAERRQEEAFLGEELEADDDHDIG